MHTIRKQRKLRLNRHVMIQRSKGNKVNREIKVRKSKEKLRTQYLKQEAFRA